MTRFSTLALVLGAASVVTAGQGGAPPAGPGLPDKPQSVPLPAISMEVEGPGGVFDSTPSLPAGKGLAQFGYVSREYFVTGTANGQPYKTRIVVRTPADRTKFSGLVLTEAMHPSGAAHMFEFTSMYSMSSGHAAVEIVTAGFDVLADHNKARYGDLNVAPEQVNEVLAQVGSLVKSGRKDGPLGGLVPRRMILAGTSATATVLIRYLPAHAVYRTPDMKTIYDGFLPTSNGTTIPPVDVPVIQVPTMTEVSSGTITARQDGNEPGDQFRVYEFAGMAHVDSRDSVRFTPDPCRSPVSRFPLEAYMAVALHHLFEWSDKGVMPPRAERILIDRDTTKDGSLMALDEHGNARGGVRNPYVDVPTAKLGVRNEGAVPPIPNPGAWIAARGPSAATLMCGLAGYQIALDRNELKRLYGDKRGYLARVEKRLSELESAGWSLPLYRERILADAGQVEF